MAASPEKTRPPNRISQWPLTNGHDRSRRWLPDAARRAGPRRAAQAVALARTRRTVARSARTGSLSTRVGSTECTSCGPFSGLRADAAGMPPTDCPYCRTYGNTALSQRVDAARANDGDAAESCRLTHGP